MLLTQEVEMVFVDQELARRLEMVQAERGAQYVYAQQRLEPDGDWACSRWQAAGHSMLAQASPWTVEPAWG